MNQSDFILSDKRVVPAHGELLRQQAEQHPQRLYAVMDEDSISYADLFSSSLVIAKGLYAQGIRTGDRVGLMMPNCIEFMQAYFAIYLLGAVAVPINARYKSIELQHSVAHSQIRLLLTTNQIDKHINFVQLILDAFAEIAEQDDASRLRLQQAPDLEQVVVFGADNQQGLLSLDDLLTIGQQVEDSSILDLAKRVSVDDIALVLFTSGTTAAPKACQLTHRNIYHTWVRCYPEAVKLKAGEAIWVPMPCFHVGGIGLAASTLAWGGTFLSSIHYQAESSVALIKKYTATHLYPGFFTLLMPLLQADKSVLDSVRSIVCVAPYETHQKMASMIPDDILVLQLFGMTEAGGYVSLTPPDESQEYRLKTTGKAVPEVQIRIVDVDSQAVLNANQQGEIQFRGPNAFHSYYNDPKATEETIIDGGWVRTGDYGCLDDDGTLRYMGRIKDMLKVGGENVAALEIEAFLDKHPSIKLTQVVAKADDYYGEVPVAFVELEASANLDEQQVIDYCKGKLSSFKIPREVRFINEWPMSATKIQKVKLREHL